MNIILKRSGIPLKKRIIIIYSIKIRMKESRI